MFIAFSSRYLLFQNQPLIRKFLKREYKLKVWIEGRPLRLCEICGLKQSAVIMLTWGLVCLKLLWLLVCSMGSGQSPLCYSLHSVMFWLFFLQIKLKSINSWKESTGKSFNAAQGRRWSLCKISTLMQSAVTVFTWETVPLKITLISRTRPGQWSVISRSDVLALFPQIYL